MIILENATTYQKIFSDILKQYCINKDILNENIAKQILDNINLNESSYLIIIDDNLNKDISISIARQLKLLSKDVYIYSNKEIEDIKHLEKLGIIKLNEYLKTDICLVSSKINNLDNKIFKEIYNINTINDSFKANKSIFIYILDKEAINLNIYPNLGEIKLINDLYFKEEKIKEYSNIYLIEADDIKKMRLERKLSDNKTDYGKNVIIAGSKEYLGAALLSIKASIKTGVGYTYYLDFLSNNQNIINEAPELIITNDKNICDNASCLAIGPGIVNINDIKDILNEYNNKKNIIIDAGALNNDLNIYNSKKILITPHTGEFSRISNISLEEILKNPIDIVKEFAKKKKINVLLKGKNTIISDGDKVYIINTGNPYMANAGMGDVLIGIISSLVAQNYSIINAAIVGTYIHGYIADELVKNQYIINPSDIVENISKYLKKIFF